MVAEMLRPNMTGDHRGLTCINELGLCGLGGMRNIDQNPKPVHFTNDASTAIVYAVPPLDVVTVESANALVVRWWTNCIIRPPTR